MSPRTALCTIVASFLFALACRAAPADGFSLVSVDEVERLLAAPDVKVFDANNRETFVSGHLPGAVLVDSRTLASALPQDKSMRLVFYCKNPH